MAELAERNMNLERELQEKDDKIIELDEENKLMYEDILAL